MMTERAPMAIPAMAPAERAFLCFDAESTRPAVAELMGRLLGNGLSAGKGSPGLSM